MELKGKKKGNVIINPKTEKMQEEEQSGQEKDSTCKSKENDEETYDGSL